jgi:hypothetical protein
MMRSARLWCIGLCLAAGVLGGAATAESAVIKTVDPGHPWLGFMNVFELPSNGGGYVFGSGWGTPDLTAVFNGDVLTLGPNTIGDPATFWYQGGGGPGAPGNKIMNANMYVEDNSLAGETVTFTGVVLANTLTSAHTSVAFIKDFAPDYSSFNVTSVPLTPGEFSITMATTPAAGRHVQFGFETTGVNVWVTDVAPFGNVQVTAIPEPAAAAAIGLAGLALGIRRRRRG